MGGWEPFVSLPRAGQPRLSAQRVGSLKLKGAFSHKALFYGLMSRIYVDVCVNRSMCSYGLHLTLRSRRDSSGDR